MSDTYYASRSMTAIAPSAFYYIFGTDFGGIQPSLPAVPASSTANAYVVVRSEFKPGATVQVVCPLAESQTTDISFVGAQVLNATTVWPASTDITTYDGAGSPPDTPADSSFVMIDGVLFGCTTAGTTGASAPTFNPTPGATTTDGSVVWTSLGFRRAVRLTYANANVSDAETPVAQDMQLFTL